MNILRLFHTIRHLQARQVYYRLWYPIKKYTWSPKNMPRAALAAAADFPQTAFKSIPPVCLFDSQDNTFRFLNISHSFGETINWDFAGHGLLWTYNLSYFEWLQDENLSITQRLNTITGYIQSDPAIAAAPYPFSLRGINWIRFLSAHKIQNADIHRYLHIGYQRLSAFPEYQIGANHLLENAFSLLYGAYYFHNEQWYRQAAALLLQELQEQVLPDGGHYERSPMYHCIILHRLLQCIELTASNTRYSDAVLTKVLREKAVLMLGWLQAFRFDDGSYAMTGDAAPGIAPSPTSLFDYAAQLSIKAGAVQLKESGYRKVKGNNWELLINLGSPSPAYQPGHAHADALSFCLQVAGRPLITDTGISTYERGAQRIWEKSTNAHNTIELSNSNSSDIWHSFRIGKRAHVFISEETGSSVTAWHDGYGPKGRHERTYSWNNQKIIVEDKIKTKKGRKALLHLHFHPDVLLRKTTGNCLDANGIRLQTEGATDLQLQEYQFCAGFNKRIKAQRLKLCAADRIAIVIEF